MAKAKKKPLIPESAPPPRLRQYEAVIFITGAVTLSLEVLASRIMTPYFGVSLYIWAGILSITLIFLALGYQLGGRLSQRREKETLPLWQWIICPVSFPVTPPLISAMS